MRMIYIQNEDQLADWARHSRPGDMAIYYEYKISQSARKMLCAMRQYNQNLHLAARKAWQLSEQGDVHLVQLRINDTNHYCAIKRDPKRIRRNVRS